MAWARLDDGFHDHPKVDGISLAAVGLYTLCLTWAHRHRRTAVVQGHITEARVGKVAGRQAASLAGELVTAGLWEVEQEIGGYVIHDFADYLPRERDPAELKEAGRKGGLAAQQRAKQVASKLLDDSLGESSSRASAPASPSRPVPSQQDSVGGERPETLQAVPATTPPNKRSRCAKHPNGNPTNENCRGCKADREHDEREAERERAAAEHLAEKAVRARRAEADACPKCHGSNWVEIEAGAPLVKCREPHTQLALIVGLGGV